MQLVYDLQWGRASGVASRMQKAARMGLLLSVGADKCINILFPPASCKGSRKQNKSPAALKLQYCRLGIRVWGCFGCWKSESVLCPPPQGQVAFKLTDLNSLLTFQTCDLVQCVSHRTEMANPLFLQLDMFLLMFSESDLSVE